MISGEALWWLPTAAAVAMTILGLLAARAQTEGQARRGWLLGLSVCGGLAIAASAWQQAVSHSALVEETARLRDIGSRLDELGKSLPAGSSTGSTDSFDTVTAGIRALNVRIEDLNEQIRALQEKARGRSIEPAAAARVAQHLRQHGPQRVVVSCVPDDVEAFSYANQIAAMLREGGWDALGPEKTTIFGEAPAMAIRLFARSAATPPDAAKILVDVFTRFSIPYQSGIAPSDAIPDPATLELFVSHKS